MVFLFKSVQVRTTNCNFLTHLLLHNTGIKTFHRLSLQNRLPQFWILIWDSFSLSCVEAERYSRLQYVLFVSSRLTAFLHYCRIICVLEIAHFRRTGSRK